MTPHAQVPRSERVLLLIDFINPLDFPGGELLAKPALAAARATVRLRERLEEEGVAVVYCNDNYGLWQSDFHSLVSQCVGRKDIAGELARLIAPRGTDVTLLKPRHSAFYGSPLELLLSEMGAKELILTGLATDICVQLTAADAFLRNFPVWVPADCTAAETPHAKQSALRYMQEILKCDVRSSRAAPPRRAVRKPAGQAKGRAKSKSAGEATGKQATKSASNAKR